MAIPEHILRNVDVNVRRALDYISGKQDEMETLMKSIVSDSGGSGANVKPPNKKEPVLPPVRRPMLPKHSIRPRQRED